MRGNDRAAGGEVPTTSVRRISRLGRSLGLVDQI